MELWLLCDVFFFAYFSPATREKMGAIRRRGEKSCNAFRLGIKITAESRCKRYPSIDEAFRLQPSHHHHHPREKKIVLLRLFANNCFLIVLALSHARSWIVRKTWISLVCFPLKFLKKIQSFFPKINTGSKENWKQLESDGKSSLKFKTQRRILTQ